MSIIPPQHRQALQFYLSGPLPCPYLPGQVERKLFTRLTDAAPQDYVINSDLTRAGFRRSHDMLYRPACPQCQACIPVRIAVAQFVASAAQRRVIRYNADLRVTLEDKPQQADGLFPLFHAYQQERHPDGDMARMSAADFAVMMEQCRTHTKFLTLRDRQAAALGVMIVDELQDGYSAVYSFFAPHETRRSLGRYMILSLIHMAAHDHLPYVYLGYWIAASRKMAYKADYQPLQMLGPHGWEKVLA